MLRKFGWALFVFAICCGITLGEEIRGVIIKVDGSKVTFAKASFNKDTKKLEKGDEQTLPVADNCKVSKGKFNKDTKKLEAGDALEGGIKNEMFSKIGEKGVGATIITDGDNKKITEIIVSAGKKAAK